MVGRGERDINPRWNAVCWSEGMEKKELETEPTKSPPLRTLREQSQPSFIIHKAFKPSSVSQHRSINSLTITSK